MSKMPEPAVPPSCARCATSCGSVGLLVPSSAIKIPTLNKSANMTRALRMTASSCEPRCKKF